MKKEISRGYYAGTLTSKVVDFVKAQILEGALKSGEYLVSERKLSQLIGVSRVTVRRGLELLVSGKIIEKKANQGYVYSGNSLDILLKKQKAVIFIHQEVEKILSTDEQMSSIWEGARLEAKENDLITMVKAGVTTITKNFAKDLARLSCAVVTDIRDRESIKNLVNENLIVVHLDYYMGSVVDNVLQDDFGGMIEGVEYLVAKNYRNLAYFSTYKSLKKENLAFNSELRLSAFKTVLDRHDITITNTTIIEVDSRGENIKKHVENILQSSVDALVFPHNYLFDLSINIIEKSDKPNIPILVWGVPQESNKLNVTHLQWNTTSMGREAVRRVMLRLKNPKIETVKILISCNL